MRKKDAATEGASEWSSAPAERITPLDVQQKEFRITRLGTGYRMREVDEFLDQVTDALSALIAENERLLRRAEGRAIAATPSSDTSTTPAHDADRGAVDAVEAFLRREKGFLQDLGGLVQAHAEELRSMIRAARRDATAPTAAAPARAEQPVADTAASVTAEELDASAGAGLPDRPEQPEPEPAPEVHEDEDAGRDGTVTGAVEEETIRLEEREPARSGRSDEEADDSLRELFWGEE